MSSKCKSQSEVNPMSDTGTKTGLSSGLESIGLSDTGTKTTVSPGFKDTAGFKDTGSNDVVTKADVSPELVGYDGVAYKVGDRVELHPGCDLWARGARFGVVVGTSLTDRDRVKVTLDKRPKVVFTGPADRFRLIPQTYICLNCGLWTCKCPTPQKETKNG